MRWTPGKQSGDIEDRRASGGGMPAGVGLLAPLAARFGLPGLLIGAALIFIVPRFLGGDGGPQPAVEQQAQQPMVEFVSFVLDDAQAVWAQKIQGYRKAKLVLFRGSTQTACGGGQAAMGPFYCPLDEKMYIDLSFYEALKKRYGAPGDFAQAYVIAHELGHHVQKLTGQMDRERTKGAAGTSVKTELQADCYAGIWAHSTDSRKLLEQGDVEEAMNAAAAVGDDRGGGATKPESWTHGSAAQRSEWFKRGHERGAIEACDTNASAAL